MNDQAQVISTKFHKSIIMSKGAMTYEQAQDKIDDPNDNDELAVSLRHLLKLSKILKVPFIYFISTCSTGVFNLPNISQTLFFRQKVIFSTLHFDEFFMLQFGTFRK
jgi:hypothetical protein